MAGTATTLAVPGDCPVSLQRFPEGIKGKQFFSKDPPRRAPDFLGAVMVTYPSGRSHPDQLDIDLDPSPAPGSTTPCGPRWTCVPFSPVPDWRRSSKPRETAGCMCTSRSPGP